MTIFATVVVPALFLENDHLVALGLLENFCIHKSPFDQRSTNLRRTVASNHENFFKFHGVTSLGSDLFDFDNVVGSNFILFAASFDDCIHRYSS